MQFFVLSSTDKVPSTNVSWGWLRVVVWQILYTTYT